jgi:hypothetical protein
MNDAVAVGLSLGGVVLGAALNDLSARRGRRESHKEQREQVRRARELVAVENLDEALIGASRALDDPKRGPLAPRYVLAREALQDGWVRDSPRIGSREARDRYRVIDMFLGEVMLSEGDPPRATLYMAARAIANARATLAHLMRGDEELPPAAFPDPDALIRLLGEGDGQDDPLKPLKDWLSDHPEPEFH